MEATCFYREYEDVGLVRRVFRRFVHGVWSRKYHAGTTGRMEI